jgi:integrase
VAELAHAFWQHAKVHYAKGRRRGVGEANNFKPVIRRLREMYGATLAKDFGPLALKAFRSQLIRAHEMKNPATGQAVAVAGWSRTYANRQIKRACQIFQFGVENELVEPVVHQRLVVVKSLEAGRSEARETDRVKPVPDAHVDAVLPFLSRQIGAMIELQRLTGMRPGEVCDMRGLDIDVSAKMWVYKPHKHKSQHLDHDRIIYLGKRAQAVLQPFLRPNLNEQLFSPAEAEAERRDRLHAQRETPAHQGNVLGSNRVAMPKRRPQEFYTVDAYRRAIARACEQAFEMPAELREPRGKKAKKADQSTPADVKRDRRQKRDKWRADHIWHPHQLRHSAGTRFRRDYGIDIANVLLGHSTLTATQIYAEQDLKKAEAVMAEVG